jgi:peptidoglycan/LPS O-acetylase OafA/YrhL
MIRVGVGGQLTFWHPNTHWLPPGYSAYDYVLGAIVALFIVGLANVRLPMPGARVERAVRGLAATTFGLYLLHYPLLNFFGTVVQDRPARRCIGCGYSGSPYVVHSVWHISSSRVRMRWSADSVRRSIR